VKTSASPFAKSRHDNPLSFCRVIQRLDADCVGRDDEIGLVGITGGYLNASRNEEEQADLDGSRYQHRELHEKVSRGLGVSCDTATCKQYAFVRAELQDGVISSRTMYLIAPGHARLNASVGRLLRVRRPRRTR
jgi:hypothetical protein